MLKKYMYYLFQYASEDSNFIIITGPNMVFYFYTYYHLPEPLSGLFFLFSR